jgi:hypothetical protein
VVKIGVLLEGGTVVLVTYKIIKGHSGANSGRNSRPGDPIAPLRLPV